MSRPETGRGNAGGCTDSSAQQLERRSNIQLCRKLGPVLNKAEARFGLDAHQVVNGFLRRRDVVMGDLDPQHGALFRVHGGFLELRRVHFAKAFEAANVDPFRVEV